MSDRVTVEPAGEADKPVLANLIQLYRHDLSQFRGYDVSAHGTFTYRYLDHYWTEAGRRAFFIRVAGQLAGFVLVRQVDAGVHEVAEFFVLRRYRGDGTAREAARQTLVSSPGEWRIFHDDANGRAGAFWLSVVTAVTHGDFGRSAVVTSAGFAGQEFRFNLAGGTSGDV